MRRYSPQYYSPSSREYGGRGRSPPRRGYSGGRGYGRRKEQNHGSLLVRNIPLDCRPEELCVPFERFGVVRDVYIPKDYYTGVCGRASHPDFHVRFEIYGGRVIFYEVEIDREPRGFAFVQFVDSCNASEAQYHMNGKTFAGREISVVVAAESRKRPEEMRQRTRARGPGPSHGERCSSYYRRSRSRSISRSCSPHYPSGSRGRYRSRSLPPAPKRRGDDGYSVSPSRRHADHPRSSREREGDHSRRSYSPGYDNGAEKNPNNEGKSAYEPEDIDDHWRSPGRTSMSPPGSRPSR